jgi:hypothetical protein
MVQTEKQSLQDRESSREEKVESSSAQAPVVFAVLLIYPPPLDPSKTNHGM